MLLCALLLACGSGAPDRASAPAPTAPVAATPDATPHAAPDAKNAAPDAKAAARPLYYDRALTDADLSGRTLRELSLMRNTIFARTGHPFVKTWLNDYFRAQPWYHPSEKADLSKLSEIDKKNADRIARYEAALTEADLNQRKDALLARRGTPAWTAEDDVEIELLSAARGEWLGGKEVAAAQRNPLEDPNVLDGLLTLDQIKDMSRRDLRLVRNTIFARHGRAFKSDVLVSYFEAKPWYHVDPAYSEAMLSEIDKKNTTLVLSVEKDRGGPLTEFEHQMEEGWFVGA